MPIYNSKCVQCNTNHLYQSTISECKNTMPICCGKQTKKQILTAPMVADASAREFQAYKCPVTEQVVTSARQKKNIEAKEGLIIKEKGIFPPRQKKFVDETPEALKPELAKYQAEINQ